MTTTETNAAYHADTSHVGSSMLRTFAGSPALFEGRYVTQTLPIPPPTDSMTLGTAVHILVLEPEKWADEILVAPEGVTRRQNKWKTLAELAEAEGKTAVTHGQQVAARAIADALLANEHLQVLLQAEGVSEQSIRWVDEETGVKCKCKPDRLVDDPDMEAAWRPELKTTGDPSEAAFGKACANYGYDVQNAHYSAGVATVIDRPVIPYIFAVRNEEPYDVWPKLQLDPDNFLDAGRRARRYWLRRLAKCIETDEWVAPEQKRPGALALPFWKLKEPQYE